VRVSGRRSEPAGESARLVRWRTQRLLAAGFSPASARGLAGDRRVDLHELLGLVDRGCPPELAARILAPLDEPRYNPERNP
jgi:hypothetical protein